MGADAALTRDQDEYLLDMTQHVRALAAHGSAELAELLASPALEAYARQVVEAVVALQMVYTPGLGAELAPLLAPHPSGPRATVANRIGVDVKYSGAARKVSVSMPEDLTAAVQQRVGHGKFSQYVTEAVSRQLERDLLAELSELLATEHGPVPEEYVAEARAAWPDGE
jgi:Arc/MetJ-type ribon-helix-helix transcriptional regulator